MAADGWDQRERVFALVPTADLVAAEPSLAEALAGAAAEAPNPPCSMIQPIA